MPLVTTTFNQKTLIRIAMVIAFVQFTNALEYMMFSPVLHLWLQISLFRHLLRLCIRYVHIWSRPVGNYRLLLD